MQTLCKRLKHKSECIGRQGLQGRHPVGGESLELLYIHVSLEGNGIAFPSKQRHRLQVRRAVSHFSFRTSFERSRPDRNNAQAVPLHRGGCASPMGCPLDDTVPLWEARSSRPQTPCCLWLAAQPCRNWTHAYAAVLAQFTSFQMISPGLCLAPTSACQETGRVALRRKGCPKIYITK